MVLAALISMLISEYLLFTNEVHTVTPSTAIVNMAPHWGLSSVHAPQPPASMSAKCSLTIPAFALKIEN